VEIPPDPPETLAITPKMPLKRVGMPSPRPEMQTDQVDMLEEPAETTPEPVWIRRESPVMPAEPSTLPRNQLRCERNGLECLWNHWKCYWNHGRRQQAPWNASRTICDTNFAVTFIQERARSRPARACWSKLATPCASASKIC
jgi:hypothetical protein